MKLISDCLLWLVKLDCSIVGFLLIIIRRSSPRIKFKQLLPQLISLCLKWYHQAACSAVLCTWSHNPAWTNEEHQFQCAMKMKLERCLPWVPCLKNDRLFLCVFGWHMTSKSTSVYNYVDGCALFGFSQLSQVVYVCKVHWNYLWKHSTCTHNCYYYWKHM